MRQSEPLETLLQITTSVQRYKHFDSRPVS